MSELSEHDRDTLRGIEYDLKAQDPYLADRLENFGQPTGAWRPVIRWFWWELTALAAAALIAVVSLGFAFIP
jgi:hypothetical protein